MPQDEPSDVLSTKTVSSIVREVEKREAEAQRKARARTNHWATATEEVSARFNEELEAIDVDAARERAQELGLADTDEGLCFLRAVEGRRLCQQGKRAEGIAVLDALIEEHPTFSLGHYARGTQALIDKSDDAIVHFDVAIALDPGNVAAYWRRGQCHLQRRDWERALADCRRAVALEPGVPDWPFKLARLLVSLKRYDEALECCSMAIARAPDYADFYHLRGETHVHLDQYAAAIPDFERALALDAAYKEARLKLAFCLWKTGEPARAQKEVQVILDAEPTHEEAVKLQQKVAFALHMLGEVIEPHNRKLEADPDNVTLLVQRANLWSLINAGQRRRDDLDRAVELAPDDMEVAEEHLRVHVSRKDPKAAIARLTAFLQRFPTSLAALEKRSAMYERLGEHDLSLADLRRRVELAPEAPASYYALAYHYRSIGRPEEGIPVIDHALTLARGDAQATSDALGVRAALRRAANRKDPRIKEDQAAIKAAQRELYGDAAFEASGLAAWEEPDDLDDDEGT